MRDTSTIPEAGTGLFGSAQRLFETVLGILRTRIEIVACEIEEEREHLKSLLLFGGFALALIGLGLIALTAFVTLWLWATHGLYALAFVGAGFLIPGLGLLAYVRHRERARPRMFATTLFEISRDQDALRGQRDDDTRTHPTAS